MQSGGAAMWYDATVAADFLEHEGLTGNLGVALAPTGPADLPGGWLWTWGFAIPENAENTAAAWEFISWATSEEYINVVVESCIDALLSSDCCGDFLGAAGADVLELRDTYVLNPWQAGAWGEARVVWIGEQYLFEHYVAEAFGGCDVVGVGVCREASSPKDGRIAEVLANNVDVILGGCP